MNNMGARNRGRVIIRVLRGDGTEGALCTGEILEGTVAKALVGSPCTCARCEPVLILRISSGGLFTRGLIQTRHYTVTSKPVTIVIGYKPIGIQKDQVPN